MARIFERFLLTVLVTAVIVNILLTTPQKIGCNPSSLIEPPPSLLLGLNSTNSTHHSPKRSKLGDGCYHIYLDVGSNIGVHARFLYEPEYYPKAQTALNIFNEQFGPNRNNQDFCVFAFEPNPVHVKRHESLRKYYNSRGWHYHPIQAAVSDSSGEMTFYHNADGHNEEWGFSDQNKKGKNSKPETVKKIRLATWLMDEIYDREIPTEIHGDYGDIVGPRVVMKLDIESQEYAVLPDVMFSGIMCKTIHFAFGEFHYWGVDYPPDATTGRGGLHIEPRKDGLFFQQHLLRAFHSVKDCMTTEFRIADDEQYLHDGIPIPDVSQIP